MPLTLNALCYLQEWHERGDVQGGLAFRPLLGACRLDYSVTSLARIDTLLASLHRRLQPAPDTFLADTAQRNFLLLLAFYSGEVIGRALGVAPRWMSGEEAAAIAPALRIAAGSFTGSIVCRFEGATAAGMDFLMPLNSLGGRLFMGPEETGIQLVAGMFLSSAQMQAGAVALPPAPLAMPVADRAARASLADSALATMLPQRPGWADGHPLSLLFDAAPRLLREGRVVWGHVVQANKLLFQPAYFRGAPGEVLYDPAGRVSPEELGGLAQHLLDGKGRPSDDAELQRYTDHLADESTVLFGHPVSRRLMPYPLFTSTTYFDQLQLPDGMLSLGWLPLLLHDGLPGLALPLPCGLWAESLQQFWRDAGTERHGQRFDVQAAAREAAATTRAVTDTRSPAEQLCDEGVSHFLGRQVIQDYARARQCWEAAAELGSMAALNNLGTLHADGLGVPANLTTAMGYYKRAALAGLAVGALNMGKLYLRPDYPGRSRDHARLWLGKAAAQGNADAVALLKEHRLA